MKTISLKTTIIKSFFKFLEDEQIIDKSPVSKLQSPKLASENDAFAIEVLRWVMSGGCEMCEHKNKREMEMDIYSGEVSSSYLEAKYNWPDGHVMNHME